MDTHKDMLGLGYIDPKKGCTKFGGWTPEGKERVKKLTKLAKDARAEPHVEAVESAALLRIRYVQLVTYW